ncbi:SEL1-like repeat protein [Roseibium sp. RKSG952]|uniref:SEL1-like repeat protein n=1 Tax=Roseibium sp. RKSG952 TaxID=2529384 RepID=UPI0012BBE2FC|nr:SEL1-like repeat protein [Roseibium sp. RKSG952]MTI00232.1 hypothetical protein [Roseibium sp. RKSG952]
MSAWKNRNTGECSRGLSEGEGLADAGGQKAPSPAPHTIKHEKAAARQERTSVPAASGPSRSDSPTQPASGKFELDAVAAELDRLLSERGVSWRPRENGGAGEKPAVCEQVREQDEGQSGSESRRQTVTVSEAVPETVLDTLDRLDQQVDTLARESGDAGQVSSPGMSASSSRPVAVSRMADRENSRAAKPVSGRNRGREELDLIYEELVTRLSVPPGPVQTGTASRRAFGGSETSRTGQRTDQAVKREPAAQPVPARGAGKWDAATMEAYHELGLRIDAMRKPQEQAMAKMRGELGALRDAVADLSHGTGKRSDQQDAELRRLGGMVERLRAERRSGAFEAGIRQEVSDLKAMVERTNVEGALETLEHGYSHILQRLDELSRASAQPNIPAGFVERLDDIEDAFSRLPRSEHMLTLEERVGVLAGRVEDLLHLDRRQDVEPLRAELRAVRRFVEDIDTSGLVQRIDAGMRGVSSRLDDLEHLLRDQDGLDLRLSAMEDRLPEADAISRLEGRLEDILGMMAEDRRPPEKASRVSTGLNAHLADISACLERIECAGAAPEPSAFHALEQRLTAITGKIDRIETNTAHTAPAETGNRQHLKQTSSVKVARPNRLNDLQDRIARLTDGLETDGVRPDDADLAVLRADIEAMRASMAAAPTPAETPEGRINDLAQTVAQREDGPALARIEQLGNRVSALAAQVEEVSRPSNDLLKVTTALERIERGLSETRRDVAGIAREAALQAVSEQTRPQPDQYDAAIGSLQKDLKRLLEATQGNEERTRTTFDGVQSVLGTLGKRLDVLERADAQGRPSDRLTGAQNGFLQPLASENAFRERPESKSPGEFSARYSDAQRDRKADFIAAARRAAQAATDEVAQVSAHSGNSQPDVNDVQTDAGEGARGGLFGFLLKHNKSDEAYFSAFAPSSQDTTGGTFHGTDSNAEGNSGTGRRRALLFAAAAIILAIGTLQIYKAVSAASSADPAATSEPAWLSLGRLGSVELPAAGGAAAGATAAAAELAFAPLAGLVDTFAIGPSPMGVAHPARFLPSGSGITPATLQGTNLPPDTVGSMALRKAAAAGHPAAAFHVGAAYTNGGVAHEDPAEAARWYRIAANQGLAPAQYRLGSLYEKGRGVERDLDTARGLYERAALAGNAKAMHNLAVLHADGVARRPDFRLAAQWFEKAALHGVNDSLFNLGILYARGLGVEKDLVQSYKWFAIAARRGDSDAAAKRDEVAAKMTPGQVIEAGNMADRFQPLTPNPDANTVPVKPEWTGMA